MNLSKPKATPCCKCKQQSSSINIIKSVSCLLQQKSRVQATLAMTGQNYLELVLVFLASVSIAYEEHSTSPLLLFLVTVRIRLSESSPIRTLEIPYEMGDLHCKLVVWQ